MKNKKETKRTVKAGKVGSVAVDAKKRERRKLLIRSGLRAGAEPLTPEC